MEAQVYNQKGESVGTVEIPESIFDVPWNPNLVHEATVTQMANARAVVAHTKDRSEVSGGGRKPWKQKGTGRARHGSIRSPIWVGGGVAFGPRGERNFKRKINKKAKTKALFVVLSKKLSEGEILFVEALPFSSPRTKSAGEALANVARHFNTPHAWQKKRNMFFITLPEYNPIAHKSFQNIGNVSVDEIRNLNVLDILRYKYLIIVNPKKSIPQLEERVHTTEKIPNLKS